MHDQRSAAILEMLVRTDEPSDGRRIDVIGLFHVQQNARAEPVFAKQPLQRILAAGIKVGGRDIPIRGDTNRAVLLDREKRQFHRSASVSDDVKESIKRDGFATCPWQS